MYCSILSIVCVIIINQYAWIKCCSYTSLNNSNKHPKLASWVFKYSRKWKISQKSSSARCRQTILRRMDAVELNINMRLTLSWNIHSRYVEKGDTLKQHLAVLLEQIKINFKEGQSEMKRENERELTVNIRFSLCYVSPSQCRCSGINRCLAQCICICMNMKWVADVCSFRSHSLSHSIGPFFQKKVHRSRNISFTFLLLLWWLLMSLHSTITQFPFILIDWTTAIHFHLTPYCTAGC